MATSGAGYTAVILDGATGKLRATIKTGTKPDAVVFDPMTRKIWVMNPGSGDITVIDPCTANIIATVVVGGLLELGAADGRGLIFVNIEDRNEVVILDTRVRRVVGRFSPKGMRRSDWAGPRARRTVDLAGMCKWHCCGLDSAWSTDRATLRRASHGRRFV